MTTRLSAAALRAFVPGGLDFDKSRRFYEALGFTCFFESTEACGYGLGSCEFILQNAYAKEWAEWFMVQLIVADLDAWWAKIEGLELEAAFGVQAPIAPKLMPWRARVAFVYGPCGELWHIVQDG